MDARERCQELGGDLASIHNEAENAAARALLRGANVSVAWIGFSAASASSPLVTCTDLSHSNASTAIPALPDAQGNDCGFYSTECPAQYSVLAGRSPSGGSCGINITSAYLEAHCGTHDTASFNANQQCCGCGGGSSVTSSWYVPGSAWGWTDNSTVTYTALASPPPLPPPATPPPVATTVQTSIFIGPTKTTWAAGQAYCESNGGRLATPTSAAMNDEVGRQKAEKNVRGPVWIGAVWIDGVDCPGALCQEGAWVDTDGSPLVYTNWHPSWLIQMAPANSTVRGRVAWSKCPPWQRPISAPAAPQGTPGGSGAARYSQSEV